MFFCIDYTNNKEFYFENPETWSFWALIDLHDYLAYFLINILLIVLIFASICLFYQQLYFNNNVFKKLLIKSYNAYKLEVYSHAPVLEFFRTILPTFMLFLMGWPSFKVLYAMEQLIDPIHTIIIIGNQWYWTYHYSDYDLVSDIILQLDSNFVVNNMIDLALDFIISKDKKTFEALFNKKKFIQSLSKYLRKFEESKIVYDCVIIPDENLPKGYPRMLSTDQVLVLPAYVSVRLLITSADVIHSWALPSHGLKMDAIPGRINQISFLAQTWGTYWGQCSELCGINHGFMPIEVRIMPLDDYLSYISLNISYRYDKLLPVVEKFFLKYILREKYKFDENMLIENIEFFI